MNDTQSKRRREKQVVREMIALYCQRNHRTPRGSLCAECAALLAYAIERSDKCPHMENKTFCSSCRTHCYRADMRDQIRRVMRFSGPRMLTVHPVMAIRHLIESKIERKTQARKSS